MQIAARNGDYITPTIVGTGEHDYDRDLNYTRNLFRLLTRDPEYGEANKALFGDWLAHLGAAVPRRRTRPAADLVDTGRQGGHVRLQSRRRHRQVLGPARKTSSSTSPRS